MGLDNISRAVLETAQNEAEHILKAGRKAAEDKVAAARAAAQHEAERRYQSGIHAIEEDLGRQLIQVRGAVNKEILAKKNARLREVFNAASKTILDLPEAEYAGLMQSLLDRTIGPQGGLVRVHPRDEKLFAQLLGGPQQAARPRHRVEDRRLAAPRTAGRIHVHWRHL